MKFPILLTALMVSAFASLSAQAQLCPSPRPYDPSGLAVR